MRECHIEVCQGGTEQYHDCQRRSACHDAGHALLLCLVTARTASAGCPRPLAGFTFDCRCSTQISLALAEGLPRDPWSDALVLLGGVAADGVVYGQAPSAHADDCVRARRLLQDVRVRLEFADAFAATRELVAHHRRLLGALTRAFQRRSVLAGSDLWRLFQASLAEPPHSVSGKARGRAWAEPAGQGGTATIVTALQDAVCPTRRPA